MPGLVAKKRTMTLDDDTVAILKDYSIRSDGTGNISAAIRMLARDWKFRAAKEILDDNLKGVSDARNIKY